MDNTITLSSWQNYNQALLGLKIENNLLINTSSGDSINIKDIDLNYFLTDNLKKVFDTLNSNQLFRLIKANILGITEFLTNGYTFFNATDEQSENIFIPEIVAYYSEYLDCIDYVIPELNNSMAYLKQYIESISLRDNNTIKDNALLKYYQDYLDKLALTENSSSSPTGNKTKVLTNNATQVSEKENDKLGYISTTIIIYIIANLGIMIAAAILRH